MHTICAQMKLLLLLAAVMSFAVETKNSVSTEGTYPPAMIASYSCSYQKGQVLAGDSAALTLSNLGGITLEDITLTMRANAKSGAGKITVKANGTQIATKTVNYTEVADPVVAWTGVMTDVQELEIIIGGHQNSLYVDTFIVSWSPAAAREVVLMKGDAAVDTLREANGGEGVLLPTMEDEDVWRFIGWSECAFWTVYEMPNYFSAGTRYYPAANGELWAVYKYTEMTGEKPYATDLMSGAYMYVNRTLHIALSGVPEEGVMVHANADIYDDNQHYWIEFTGTDTAYITHIPTGTPIGYNKSAQMEAKASPWKVYHEGDQTLFWTTISGKNYVLWLNVPTKEDYTITYAGLLQTNPQESPMGLQDTYMPTEVLAFTCHPECGVGIEQVEWREERGEWKVVFGIYELYIRDGKKYLKIR